VVILLSSSVTFWDAPGLYSTENFYAKRANFQRTIRGFTSLEVIEKNHFKA
jgi:hypothetical protein